MNRGKTVMLVMALVLLGSALICFGVTVLYTSLSYYEIYKSTSTLGSVILGLIYWIPVVCYGMMTALLAGGILPFDLILINKFKVKTWYTRTLLIVAIVIIALSFLMIFSLPVANRIINATRQASRSASSMN